MSALEVAGRLRRVVRAVRQLLLCTLGPERVGDLRRDVALAAQQRGRLLELREPNP